MLPLGLATRNEAIDDTPASEIDPAKANAKIEVVSFIRNSRARELIRRIANERVGTFVSHETPAGAGRHLDVIALLASAEVLSREGFPKVLNGLGLEGNPNAVNPERGLPGGVENQLSGLGFPETLAVVRDLHAAIRNDGESPARLGALVRGYAQLGVMSEFHWNPAHKGYKARALPYAQRMDARDDANPLGFWHRAFALTLAGRHRDALRDLDTAAKKAVPRTCTRLRCGSI